MAFLHLTPAQLHERLQQQSNLIITDIRDQNSFATGHLPGAQHLHNDNVEQFLTQVERQTPVVVCCYHGISSQSAAAWLSEQGYTEVYSLDGGYEAWSLQHPDLCERG